MLSTTLQQAVNQRASDIHIEPTEHGYQNPFANRRCSYPQPPISAALGTTLAARLKVLGQLDIAERRLPQDGQFTVELASVPVSFVSQPFPVAVEKKSCFVCFTRYIRLWSLNSWG